MTAIVGGFNSQQKHGGQDGVRFILCRKEQQAAAVRFLNDNAFATPTWALKPEVLRRIEPSGALDRDTDEPARVLNSLLNGARFDRLVEQEAIDGRGATSLRISSRMCGRGIWRELEAPARCRSMPTGAICSEPTLICCPRNSTAAHR